MRAEAGVFRRGFTLVELLVVTALVATLAALLVSAVSAVRDNGKVANTANAIARLDQVIMNQFRRHEWRSVSTAQLAAAVTATGFGRPAARAWHLRRNMISADMPDRWSDVEFMANNAAQFTSSAQATYIATWNAFTATQRTIPGTNEQQHVNFKYGGAECLFMIVMQGGLADCLDCNGLAQITKGDKDGDGAPEFWDDWGNPIDYILWAPGFQRTTGSDKFFDTLDDPNSGRPRPGLGMRPLIYSAGPDGEYGLERNGDAGTLALGSGCGDWQQSPTANSGRPTNEANRADNIVNVELTTGS